HADAVAEDRAAAVRTRRVDRDDSHADTRLTPGADERVAQRALATAGRAGEAHDPGLARAGPKPLEQLRSRRVAPLHPAQRARHRTHLPRQEGREQPLGPLDG